jgi:hypothetical protein
MGQLNWLIAKDKKVGLMRHPQLINMKQNKYHLFNMQVTNRRRFPFTMLDHILIPVQLNNVKIKDLKCECHWTKNLSRYKPTALSYKILIQDTTETWKMCTTGTRWIFLSLSAVGRRKVDGEKVWISRGTRGCIRSYVGSLQIKPERATMA